MNAPATDTVLLVGNPNVGKSVIFSYLTGRYSIVSNYPGTTVEISRGRMGFSRSREVIDTPGVNSLFPMSEDERATRNIILENRDTTIVQVADAKNLFRALLLTTQLAELECRVILVLNMMDEARQRGLLIDSKALSRHLGIAVIPAVAVEKRGLHRLVGSLNAGEAAVPRVKVVYPTVLGEAIEETGRAVEKMNDYGIFGTLTVITGDRSVLEGSGRVDGIELSRIAGRLAVKERTLPNPYSYYIATARKEFVERFVGLVEIDMGKSVRRGNGFRRYVPFAVSAAVASVLYLVLGPARLSGLGLHPTIPVLLAAILGITYAGEKRINRITLHPFYGILVVLVVLYLIYMLVGVFAAGALVDLFEKRLFEHALIPYLSGFLSTGWVKDLLFGDFGLVSMGLKYAVSIVLPIVFVFFLLFALLEDSGYFPRLTVLTNNIFRVVGLNGKATLPVILGFGCVTMAVLASRILESRRERLIVVALMALAVPCSAQLGVIMALLSVISTKGVILITGIIVGEFFFFGHLLSRLYGGKRSDFILELPPLRTPKPSNIVLKTGARVKWFIREALPFFILATLILFVLDKSGGLSILYRIAEPVTARLLGLPVETTTVFIIGFFRRDYGAAGLYSLWEKGVLVGNQVVVALVVMSLFLPCLATLIVMIKELGLRYAVSILLFILAASIASGSVLHLVLNLTGARL
ncbi:MAG TPA: ferrous iron transport protein B [Patescibacteria group bacterium]|nr:ferrous iron transport protein B [Patescibacteria group bacterium]